MLICFLLTQTSSAAITWIYSQPATVSIQGYTLTIQPNKATYHLGDNITFTGFLKYEDGTPIPSRAIYVQFANTTSGYWQTLNATNLDGSWSDVSLTDLTAPDGSYGIVWLCNFNGTNIQFHALCAFFA